MSKKKSIWSGEWGGYVKAIAAIILVIIGYPLVKNMVNAAKNGLNIGGAVSDAKSNAPALRLAVLQSYATTIHDQVHGFTNGGYTVQQTLKSCVSGEEVAVLSEYYKRTYSESLLTVAKAEMGSMFSFSKSFDSLPEWIKNNLS